ncbi:MAG: Ribokinase-like protein [Monoraphidium minutum]|nr:MAG: Ribokinase-like protein [Monoraphidium minutum]
MDPSVLRASAPSARRLQRRTATRHPSSTPTARAAPAAPPARGPAPAAAAAAGAGAPARPPLVVVGSVNADLVLAVDRVPTPGETLGAASMAFFPGGKGANQAAAAARLGYPTYFIGEACATGTDAYAAPLRDALAGCGVRLDYLGATEGPSGTAVILLQPSGENSIIIVGGANQDARSWALPPPALDLLRSAGAVLLQREVPEDVNIAVAKAARGAGVPVILDAGGVDAPVPDDLLSQVSILSPNETELGRLTRLPTGSDGDVEAAARSLMARGVGQVLVKLGGEGSMHLPGPGAPALRQAAVPAPKVVDTTGAGDCFTAAFAVALLEGLEPQAALRFASAAASICVGRAGAMPSLPSVEEVQELLDSL